MNYNVAQLLKEPTGSQRNFTIGKTFADSETLVEQVVGAGRMVRTHQGIWVQADITATVSQGCSRCLVEFNRTLELELEEEYLPIVDVNSGRRVDLPEDWGGLVIGDDHTLNITEAVRQTAITELPLKPLCRPECGGICDRCGTDLNTTDCDCYALDIDPRWAALRALLVD